MIYADATNFRGLAINKMIRFHLILNLSFP